LSRKKFCKTVQVLRERRHPAALAPVQHLKFYSIFFKKSRGRGAVRQRKFGFQPKLPGRKRPSSGDFSDLRSEARHTPRRPLSLPYGRGVGAPSPQAPPFQAGCRFFPQTKVLLDFFQKIAGSRGSEATEVWVPAQTSGAQAPFFGGLLGPTVRSAAYAATPPQFALRARGRRPLPVGPSLPGWGPLFPPNESFTRFFSKNRGVEGQGPRRSPQRAEYFIL